MSTGVYAYLIHSQRIIYIMTLSKMNPITFAGHKVLPLMLSPMAGITNAPFRNMCIEWTKKGINEIHDLTPTDLTHPGIFVNEMVAASKLENSIKKAKQLLCFNESEKIRSAQIYCLNGESAYNATTMILENNLANHIDLNFGCPAKKVTAIGGGSAIPLKPNLYREIVRSVMHAVNNFTKCHDGNLSKIEVSVKFRIGLDENHITYQNAAKIAVDEGISALTMHARMAKQFYSGNANWDYIKELVNYVKTDLKSQIPIFGNGDIFSKQDADSMIEKTGCQGITIGRGVVGRPWLFYELLTGKCPIVSFADVKKVILHHLDLVIKWTEEIEKRSVRHAVENFRVYIGSYLKGFNISGTQKKRLLTASSLQRFTDILNSIDETMPFDEEAAKKPRVKTDGSQIYVLPQGWLQH